MQKTLNNKWFKLLISLFACFIASIFCEILCMYAVGRLGSFYDGFNFQRFFFFLGVSVTVLLIICIWKKYIQKIENMFLCLVLIFGSVMILSSPFGHIAWDLESHFRSIVSMSSWSGEVTEAEALFAEDGAITIYRTTYLEDQDLINKSNELDLNNVHKSYNNFSLAHLPGALVYSISKIVHVPFSVRLDLIRFTYLILYSLICYFAIKKLKTNKLIFSTIALFPTCIFLASNITYDWWIISFVMLGCAYFFSEVQQPDKYMKPYEILIMMGSLFLGCFIKSVYFLILILPFFMKKNYFKKDKKELLKYYGVVVLFLVLLLFVFCIIAFSINSTGDNRGGNSVNPAAQVSFIFTNPLSFSFILFNFFTQYLSIGNLCNFASSFAELSPGGNLPIARDFGFFIVLLIVVTVIDRNKYDSYTTTLKYKIVTILIFVASVVLIITALYIDYNNVGATTINGVQARYILPLLPVILPTLGSNKISLGNNWPTNKTLVLYVSMLSLFMYWDIAHVMLLKLL